jgi:hypothetical protein
VFRDGRDATSDALEDEFTDDEIESSSTVGALVSLLVYGKPVLPTITNQDDKVIHQIIAVPCWKGSIRLYLFLNNYDCTTHLQLICTSELWKSSSSSVVSSGSAFYCLTAPRSETVKDAE